MPSAKSPTPKGPHPLTHPVDVSERLTLELPLEWYAVVNKTEGRPSVYALFMFEGDAVEFIQNSTGGLEIKKISC